MTRLTSGQKRISAPVNSESHQLNQIEILKIEKKNEFDIHVINPIVQQINRSLIDRNSIN